MEIGNVFGHLIFFVDIIENKKRIQNVTFIYNITG